MASPILLGFNFSLGPPTPCLRVSGHNNTIVAFIVAKIHFIRIRAAMKNEYIETKGKYNATKVEGSVWAPGAQCHRPAGMYISTIFLVGWTYQVFDLVQIYTPTVSWKALETYPEETYLHMFYWCIISYCIYYCQKKTLLRQHLYMILSFDSNSGCAMTD